jgi:cytoskeleton protein RodZ
MGSFGERLRREREMRGVTLDEISSSTKIARRHLEALETENFDSLPGGVFNRGFVRAYARFLGIDEEQAVADYVAASGELSQTEPAFPLEIPPESKAKLNPRRSSLPLLLALLALVIVLAIFWSRNKRQPEANESAVSNPATTPVPNPASTPVSAQSPLEAAVPAQTAPTVAPVSAVTAGTPVSEEAQPTQTPALSPSQTPSSERTFSVVIEAKEDAWITAYADGQTVISGKTLRAGEHEIVRAGRRITLVTGNAGGIEVSFNGKPQGPLGNESERRSLTFTAAGLVQ